MVIGIDARALMQQNYSGVSWYAFNLLTAIFELDQKNDYRLFYNSSHSIQMPDWQKANVKNSRFNYSNKLFNFSLKFFDRPKIDQLIGGVDVFFTPNPNFIALSKNCRKILTVHDLSFLRFPEFFPSKSRLWHWLIFQKNLALADQIIAVSENTKRDLIGLLGVPESKIKVIYEGVADKFRPMAEGDEELTRVKAKYNLPDKFILYLGTLEPRKNLASLIEAFNLLPWDGELVIGGGRGWKSEKIFEMAQKNPKIKIIGYADEVDKPALYNLAEIFVYPSYYEGFGLPILEAMASGCPVVCGNNSSQSEVAGEAGLLVDVYNINEIKTSLSVLLSDETLKNEMIAQGLSIAKKFTWQKAAGEMTEVFNLS